MKLKHLLRLIALLILSVLPFPEMCLSQEKVLSLTEEGPLNGEASVGVELSRFERQEDAEAFAGKLRDAGYSVLVRSEAAEKEGKGFLVLLLLEGSGAGDAANAAGGGRQSGDGAPAEGSRRGDDILGRRGGYFHGSASLTAVYTDNAYRTRDDVRSDFSLLLTPELWVAVPQLDGRPQGIRYPYNLSPGGLIVSRTIRAPQEGSRTYQAFLGYRADVPLSSQNSPSGNSSVHTVSGGLQYNPGRRLSLDAIDEFSRSYEARGTGMPETEVDKYRSNLFSVSLNYDTGNRLRFRFDYSNFLLSYDASENSFRDRTDNIVSFYSYYRIMPKTSAFVEYETVYVGYEDEQSGLDSIERHALLGLEWRITAKSAGAVKGGYGVKDFSDISEEGNDFIFEAQISHKFTPKTSLVLTAFRKMNETDIEGTFFIMSSGIHMNYQQMLTSKITAAADLWYIRDSYEGEFISGGDSGTRRDRVYEAAAGVQYEFTKWLKSGIGYIFAMRDSSFSEFDYKSNTMFFRLTGSL